MGTNNDTAEDKKPEVGSGDSSKNEKKVFSRNNNRQNSYDKTKKEKFRCLLRITRQSFHAGVQQDCSARHF